MASDETIRAEALDWAVRTGDPAFTDWDAFAVWLEADLAHARAYDVVSVAVEDAARLVAQNGPANDDLIDVRPSRRWHPAWLAGGMAAAAALIVAVWTIGLPGRDLYMVETSPGETRSVALENGTQVALAGGTAMAFDRDDTRFARLDRGQALFTVRHDAQRPFEVLVGKERLVDLGTVFDVRSDAGALSVAVAEGAVSYEPEGAAVRVGPGQVLRRAAGATDLVLADVPAEQVGEWKEGRLTFEAAPLSEVAARLTRATGIAYVAASGGNASVSGSLLIAPLRKDPAAIGPMLGVAVRSEGERWVIGDP
jgi:transmembrane sensor